MENQRAILFSGVAFVISLILIAGYVSQREAELTGQFGDEVTVIMATRNIPEYTLIRPGDIAVNTTLGKKMYKKFREPSAAVRLDQVLGKSAYVAIGKGEQITLTKLISQDGRPAIDDQVGQKMRAVTLLAPEANVVGRLIRPGDRVDVLATPSYQAKGNMVWEVKTIVQNVLVLAVGRHVQNETPATVDEEAFNKVAANAPGRRDIIGSTAGLSRGRPTDNYRHITLQLSTVDAEKVLYLVNTFGDGNLYYTLRNGADNEVVALKTTLLDDILGPDSDYGRSKRKAPKITPRKPKFYDSIGGSPKPVY